ncbi:hypothetical protein [Klebsiella pneumoniae]|uniref:hypothetical protein n=1 Tax=Klebsiella pneumoniae TaxID=573 RepID=UPI0029F5257D|nr:hypothetical protein [Klebsiella pneumoniae]MDX8059364.1 hypothetical protein [Klebsiella pneumoniae]
MPAKKYTIDMVEGKRFNRLTGLAVFKTQDKRGWWERKAACICDCGTLTAPYVRDLFNGRAYSCGCYHRECLDKFVKDHSGDYSPQVLKHGRKQNKEKVNDL